MSSRRRESFCRCSIYSLLLLLLAPQCFSLPRSLPSRSAFAEHAQCPRTCGELPSNIVLAAWTGSGVHWASAALGQIHEHCGYREPALVTAVAVTGQGGGGGARRSSNAISNAGVHLPPRRDCSLVAVQSGITAAAASGADESSSWLAGLESFSPRQLKVVHIIREPFEFVVAAYRHHALQRLDCDHHHHRHRRPNQQQQVAAAAVCSRLASRPSPVAGVRLAAEIALRGALKEMVATHERLTQWNDAIDRREREQRKKTMARMGSSGKKKEGVRNDANNNNDDDDGGGGDDAIDGAGPSRRSELSWAAGKALTVRFEHLTGAESAHTVAHLLRFLGVGVLPTSSSASASSEAGAFQKKKARSVAKALRDLDPRRGGAPQAPPPPQAPRSVFDHPAPSPARRSSSSQTRSSSQPGQQEQLGRGIRGLGVGSAVDERRAARERQLLTALYDAPFDADAFEESRRAHRRGDGRGEALAPAAAGGRRGGVGRGGGAAGTAEAFFSAMSSSLSSLSSSSSSSSSAAGLVDGLPLCLLLANYSYALGYAGTRLSAEARCSGGRRSGG